MNKQRRERIASVISQLTSLHEEIEAIKDEEQEYYDNMPEGIQSSSKGEAAEEAVSNLECSCDSIQEAIDNLEAIE
jgi:uncharacterized coiled-coil DUF342 family protein